jgi:hypothetical protein
MEPDSISEQNEQRNISDRPGRKRFTRKKLCLLLVPVFVILAVLLFYAINVYHTPDLDELLARAKLTKLPESIKNLQVETRPYMDNGQAVPNAGELFIRFEAEPDDIDNFINNSPGINKNRIRPLSTAVNSNLNPPWWIINRAASGRIYSIPEHGDSHAGTVVIDDDSGTVLIYMWFVVNPQIPKMQNAIEDIYDEFVDFLEDLLHEVVDLFD